VQTVKHNVELPRGIWALVDDSGADRSLLVGRECLQQAGGPIGLAGEGLDSAELIGSAAAWHDRAQHARRQPPAIENLQTPASRVNLPTYIMSTLTPELHRHRATSGLRARTRRAGGPFEQ
jgi:hypothetical protein